MIYCDTSLLLSSFVGDQLEQDAIEQLDRLPEQATRLCWTSWHALEFSTALERMIGNSNRSTTREEGRFIRAELDSWLTPNGILERRQVAWPEALRRAHELGQQYAAEMQLRSLDVVHVAIALQLQVSEFWSFDHRQRELAAAMGLTINLWRA